MELNDLIMVSVDDHCVEPENLFDNHISAKYRVSPPLLCTNPTARMSGFMAASKSRT